ncbi:MAG: glycosyltransferase family 39 protein, partial [Anaerolineae bacterium]|nr:glycosyltransferase family 39 protein [Anaerolineae bacterium]
TASNLAIPLLEKPDERWHYPVVKHLADGHGLPVYDPDLEQPWKQEGSQPPLYYALAALITGWIPSDDFWALRDSGNPYYLSMLHGSRGDNQNIIVHYPQREGFPYRGAVLALHLARQLSVLMALATVLATYLIALEIAPGDRLLALGAAAVVGFNPMFLFIGSSVSNDATVAAMCAWTGLGALRLALRPEAPTRRALGTGIALGLALLSKSSAVALVPVVGGALVIAAWRTRSRSQLLKQGLLLFGVAALVSGWWFWRSWRLYGDPLGAVVHQVAFRGGRTTPFTLDQLRLELRGVEMSFWAVFGWRSVVVDEWIYHVLFALDRLGMLGVLMLAVRQTWLRLRVQGPLQTLLGERLPVPALLGLSLLMLWSGGVFVALLRFMSLVHAEHGRLLFAALAATAVLLIWGWRQFIPRRAVAAFSGVVVVGFLVLSIACLVFYIIPVYARPPRLDQAAIEAIPHRLDVNFGDQMRLLGYQIGTDTVHPGETMSVTLYWQAMTTMDTDYTVFVHLLDETGIVVAQRDTYPGLGNAPTSTWQAGEAIADTYPIPIPSTTYAPSRAQLEVGLYNHRTPQRLPVYEADGIPRGDSLRFATVEIVPNSTSAWPNPLQFNFQDRIALRGYELDRRVLAPGETARLTLYWQALAPMEEDYVVFVQALRQGDQRWAGDDSIPQQGAAPTSGWEVGQVIVDEHALSFPLDAPEDVYDIEIGWYSAATGQRLKVWDERDPHHEVRSRVRLSKIRVTRATE